MYSRESASSIWGAGRGTWPSRRSAGLATMDVSLASTSRKGWWPSHVERPQRRTSATHRSRSWTADACRTRTVHSTSSPRASASLASVIPSAFGKRTESFGKEADSYTVWEQERGLLQRSFLHSVRSSRSTGRRLAQTCRGSLTPDASCMRPVSRGRYASPMWLCRNSWPRGSTSRSPRQRPSP